MRNEPFDIVINGGSLGAVAAALAAGRKAKDCRILLIEPTDLLGGQATSQGVSAIDYPHHEPARSLLANNPDLYLPQDYLHWINGVKKAGKATRGYGYGGEKCCWVSRECFDPRSGGEVLYRQCQKLSNLHILFMTVVKKVDTSGVQDEYGAGRRINSLQLIRRLPRKGMPSFSPLLSQQMPGWFSTKPDAYFDKEEIFIIPRRDALTVIDASEWGDVICLSGAEYTVGREIEAEEPDSHRLPQCNEQGTQSFVFPFCEGTGENPSEVEHIRRIFPDIQEYIKDQSATYFSLKDFSWQEVWTYRRLKNNGTPGDFKTPNKGDITMQNWFPGNDYPYGSLFKSRKDTKEEYDDWQGGLQYDEIRRAEKHALAFHSYYKEKVDDNYPIQFLYGNDSRNMMDTVHGLSKLPYFRGTRRITGLYNFRILEKYYNANPHTSYRFFDTVGIGNYTADIHPVTTHDYGVSPRITHPLPFYIPYRALGSSNVRNLLAAGKNYAQTFITNSAYRVHPVEWAAGTAAGIASVFLSQKNLSNYSLLKKKYLGELQKAVASVAPLHWEAFDSETLPTHQEEIFLHPHWLRKDTKGITLELFYPQARAVCITVPGEMSQSLITRQGKASWHIPFSYMGKPVVFEWLDENGEILHRSREVLSSF